MYTLTLTNSDRKAFSGVLGQYASGDITLVLADCLPEGSAWDDKGDITFSVSEYQAWEIDELASEEDYSFPCFASDLRHKMQDFCNSIV